MPPKLKTTGHLRAFLIRAIQDVNDGTLDPNRAHAITKLAAQVNASLLAEIETAQMAFKEGKNPSALGEMVICSDIEPSPKTIDAKPLPAPARPPGHVGDWAVPKASGLGDPPPGRSALDQRMAASRATLEEILPDKTREALGELRGKLAAKQESA